MDSQRNHSRLVIGWREWVALPELGVKSIKAKIDTGARSSALHAYDLSMYKRGRSGELWVRFEIHPEQRSTRKSIVASAPVLDQRRVKSSSGESELRPVILTEIELMGKRWHIDLTLTNRDEMGFRMLLGRQAVRKRFLVDPGGSFRAGKRKRTTKKKKKRT